MTLDAHSIDWAVDFVSEHSDSDLFPRILEFEAVKNRKADFVNAVAGKPLESFPPGAHRRFIVPKDDVSYRQATQLDPQDSILLTAAVMQFGQGIEDRRFSPKQVFGYRFSPDPKFGLYDNRTAWNDFWEAAYELSQNCGAILYCDIADFYNQIYHHTIENQLNEAGFPNQVTKWIMNLLKSTTAGVSRGVPIGPHAIHLIAESTFIPIDNNLEALGFKFLRFVDDILIFCDSKKVARTSLASIAEILDKQQRLMLQQHKTRIYAPTEFQAVCSQMIEDRPISDEEDRVLNLIRKYSGGNPYATVLYGTVSESDWKSLDGDVISNIIREYIDKDPADYIRLRWFYRRLTQIGHPGAIEISLRELERLGPCFANICLYLGSVQALEPSRWKYIGEKLLTMLDADEVKTSEFYRLSILSLFSRNAHINHFAKLASRFASSDPCARREILLAARTNGAFDWLRQFKEYFPTMDPWQKYAFMFCTSGFPFDERKYFLRTHSVSRPFEKVLANWSKAFN